MAIRKLSELALAVKAKGTKTRIAVVSAEDSNTLGAIIRAAVEEFVSPILLGSKDKIMALCEAEELPCHESWIIDCASEVEAAKRAVEMVRRGEADVLMKGLIGTDKFLKAVLDKEKGLLPPKAVMSYVCALELPRYDKLLFVSDTAVLPYPNLDQLIAMTNYAVRMAHRFGIEQPKVALISATEKPGAAFPASLDYAMITKMAERGQIKDCIIDGPLDIFLACDPSSLEIKGVDTPIGGDADVLIFPNIEAANSFYKGLMLFAGGELAGLIQGTIAPVVVMSRSESAESKYYCIALSCLMAEER